MYVRRADISEHEKISTSSLKSEDMAGAFKAGSPMGERLGVLSRFASFLVSFQRER